MKKKIPPLLLCIVFALCCSFRTAPLHTEIVADFYFETHDDGLYVLAVLEKHHLTLALQSEGICAPQDMLAVCGDQYVKDNFQLTINGKAMTMDKEGMDVKREQIIYSYKVKEGPMKIEELSVNSTYMLKYNEHAFTRVAININDQQVQYNLRASRQTLTASF